MKIYLLDVGVLSDRREEYLRYDRQHSYCDINMVYLRNIEDALTACDYIKEECHVGNSYYVIVSKSWISDEIVSEYGYIEKVPDEIFEEGLEEEPFSVENVVVSLVVEKTIGGTFKISKLVLKN